MNIYYALSLYILFFIIAIVADDQKKSVRRQFVIVVCVILTIMAGVRNPKLWADTVAYVETFNHTHSIFNLTSEDHPLGYTEMGFFYLTAFIKTFTSSQMLFLTAISALIMYFLYKFVDKYCAFPLFALAIYLSRFYVGRNMMQLRACLAIAIIVYFTFLVIRKDRWKYLVVILVTYTLHHSAIVALPLLLLGKRKIKSSYIYWGIGVAFVLALFFGGAIRSWVQNSDYMMDMASSYIQEGSEKAFASDLSNPVIWYQVLVLFMFTFFEDKFSRLTPYYYVIRNGYFYCTFILIVMCQFAIVAARTSTIFATYEMVMVPIILTFFKKDVRAIPYIVLGIAYAVLFYLNYPIALR